MRWLVPNCVLDVSVSQRFLTFLWNFTGLCVMLLCLDWRCLTMARTEFNQMRRKSMNQANPKGDEREQGGPKPRDPRAPNVKVSARPRRRGTRLHTR